MVSRRMWARIVFLGEIFLFPLNVYQWRRTIDEDGDSIPLVPRWLVAGAGFQVTYCWAYDRDIGAIRTKRWRRVLLAALWFIPALRALPRSENVLRNFSIGASIGRIGYRLWYGVLRPLPGTGE